MMLFKTTFFGPGKCSNNLNSRIGFSVAGTVFPALGNVHENFHYAKKAHRQISDACVVVVVGGRGGNYTLRTD